MKDFTRSSLQRAFGTPATQLVAAALRTVSALLILAPGPVLFAQEQTYSRKADVIYGKKYGMALTMDILQPKEGANGLGVVFVVSGGWYSAHSTDGQARRVRFLLDRGYTVFAVVHGSQPKFAIPEILEDLHRAVRFIRFHAGEHSIAPDRIGITGSSAGGHLSLMQGMAGDLGRPEAKDPIDRMSSRVQAVACYFPPTDFLNYGKPGEVAIGRGILWNYFGAFDFRELDPSWGRLAPITDEARIREIGRLISPVTHVTADDAPTLIIHGDKDWLVPIQQANVFIEKLQSVGVEAKLEVKVGGDHGWPKMSEDDQLIADWFDKHLKADGSED